MSILWFLIIGVLGAILGGYVFSLFGINSYGLIGQLITSVLGAVLVLWIASFVKRTA